MADWLDDLKDKILVAEDKKLFEEVAECYRHDLFRAGYILAWILLMQSIRRKIAELVTYGDSRAKDENKKIEAKEKAHESVDKQIYKSAHECDIIDDAEFTLIDNMWEQRCLYAHPYSTPAQKHDLEHIVNQIIDISLSKEVVFSRSMLDEMVKNNIENPHIIPTELTDLRQYILTKMVRVQPKHYPYLYKTLFFEYSNALDRKDFIARNFCCMFVCVLVKDFKAVISEAIYTLDKQLREYPFPFLNLWMEYPLWPYLSAKQQDDIFRFINSLTNKSQKDSAINKIFKLIKHGATLDKDKKKSYYNLLGGFTVTSTERFYFDKDLYIDRLYNEFIKDAQYSLQGEYVDFLMNKEFPLVDYNKDQVRRLGGYMALCCRVGTFKAEGFVKETSLWSKDDNFAYGMVYNFVAKDNSTIISSSHLHYLFKICKARPDVAINALNDSLALPNWEHLFDFKATEYTEEVKQSDLEENIKDLFIKLIDKCKQ